MARILCCCCCCSSCAFEHDSVSLRHRPPCEFRAHCERRIIAGHGYRALARLRVVAASRSRRLFRCAARRGWIGRAPRGAPPAGRVLASSPRRSTSAAGASPTGARECSRSSAAFAAAGSRGHSGRTRAQALFPAPNPEAPHETTRARRSRRSCCSRPAPPTRPSTAASTRTPAAPRKTRA